MTFAEKLRTILKQAGMSQEKLAEKLGVSRRTITNSRPCILNPLLPVYSHRKPFTTNLVFGRKTRVFNVEKTKIRGTTSVTDFFVLNGNSKGIPKGILENRLEFSDFQPEKANLSVQNLATGCGLPVSVSGEPAHRKS